ncbi:MAG: type II secretion system F family protein [Phycisphaeraceae bacterium]|nr:MAG: type II secretion system F family protein [Phycisphaeraceae bacterium]
MPTFEYNALSRSGERVAGVLSGASEQAVLAELESRNLTPVSLEERAEATRRGGRVGARALGMAYVQMGDLLRAGVPILRSLRLIAGRKSQPRLAEAFRELSEAVASGEDLGSAMARRPDCFPPVQVAMVRAGERGGFLEAVLTRLGTLVIGQADLKAKIIGSLIYPAILVFAGAGITGAILIAFVPQFEKSLERVKDLPTITTALFALSGLLREWWPAILIVSGVLATLVVWGWRRPAWRERVDTWLTRAPVVGPLVRAVAAARFCRMLGTMLGNGVPMLAAMQIAREASGNALMERAIEQASEAVRGGQHLAPPLEASGLFEDDIIEMISVGEAANNLDDVLVSIAATIESRVDRLLDGVLKLIPPVLLLVIGSVVMVVAVALLVPIMRMRSGA